MTQVLVIGGGFFGMYLADHFARSGCSVRLVEKESQFMRRASYSNQARVHNGYHYPRSILTALRSRTSFPRFVQEFKPCIESDFEKYYMIGARLGKVSANQFLKFCERIGAKCESAPPRIRALTNPALIEACFSVLEYAFNADVLRALMMERLAASSVTCSLNATVETLRPRGEGLQVEVVHGEAKEPEVLYADHVFNCTYSRINYVISNSGLELVKLRHELTEICLVEAPDELKGVGITVMCGPFFSMMPFPPAGLHSFSHVRYTPHDEWQDGEGGGYRDAHAILASTRWNSAWRYMLKDAERYIPALAGCRYRDSLWEVKTILPRSESDDSRPILFLPHYRLKGLHCVLGGKIDNVYDAIEAITAQQVVG